MATVFDVGAFIHEQVGPTGGYRLQKLLYYAQAWSIAWNHRMLFEEPIQAWTNGPVCPAVWASEKKGVRWWERGSSDVLSDSERATILAAVQFYNGFSNDQLIELSHREQPWREARRGYAPEEPGDTPIGIQSMATY